MLTHIANYIDIEDKKLSTQKRVSIKSFPKRQLKRHSLSNKHPNEISDYFFLIGLGIYKNIYLH